MGKERGIVGRKKGWVEGGGSEWGKDRGKEEAMGGCG